MARRRGCGACGVAAEVERTGVSVSEGGATLVATTMSQPSFPVGQRLSSAHS
ncbi:MAG: hypothetical protein ABTQ32_22970 [Myxococcaceae bacterium]